MELQGGGAGKPCCRLLLDNTSVFSMQKAVELDIVVRNNPGFIDSVRQTVDHRVSQGHRVESAAELTGYNRVIASLQQLHQLLN